MNYIKNIANLPNRKLNQLSRLIVKNSLGSVKQNVMIQSSVVKHQKKHNYNSLYDYMCVDNDADFVAYNKRKSSRILCNIQQIKSKYDAVLFLMYYKNSVAIYCINKPEYVSFSTYKTRQHSGNTDESQIIINSKNVKQLDKHLVSIVKYKDLM